MSWNSFLIFPKKQVLTLHANWSPLETICMKCQILFSAKNKKKYKFVFCSSSPQSGKCKTKRLLFDKLMNYTTFDFKRYIITSPSPAEPSYVLLCNQCRSRPVGFWRSQLIWICTVCKGRAYRGSAEQGLMPEGLQQTKPSLNLEGYITS